MKKRYVMILFGIILALIAAGCSNDDGDDNENPTGKACNYSYECDGEWEFCVDGHCLDPKYAPACTISSDCPDQLHQECIDGKCYNIDCKTPAECPGTNQSCTNHKCVPECLRDTDCTDKYGPDYRCHDKVCEYTGTTDGDTESDQAEEEEEYVDPCIGATQMGCSDFANSCAYDLLHCSDFVGRDWTECYYYKDTNGNTIGQTIYFAGGDWFRQYNDGTFAAGKNDDFCYFMRSSGRMNNEAEYLDAQGNHLAYVFLGAAFIRVECPDKVECYRTNSMLTCDDFPYPLIYIPKETHPLVCTDEPQE